MVVTFEPSACTANTVHDLTLRPSSSTVHAPHWLVSHPTWVPVRLSCSRRKCTSSVRGSTCALRILPLMVMESGSIGRRSYSQRPSQPSECCSKLLASRLHHLSFREVPMSRVLSALLALAFLLQALPSSAQTGDGSIRGYVKDEQGAVLPGVTVTALSPALLSPVTSVTDAGGYYRLLNLPPGTYAVTAELAGFSSWRREGIIMRAGITFSVDVDLKIGTLAETVTVTGDSPMIETNRPTSVLNIDGELVRSAPITSRRLFSDALDLAPGVGSRNVDDGVGRRAYYFRGSHIYAHAFQLEGAPASAYIDSAAHSMGMGGDTVQDVEIKLGGADASTPLSTGVVMNVVTPRGQNQLKGSFSYSYQPLSWNEIGRASCRERV